MPPLQKCFVIMSFSEDEDLNRAYQEGIKEAVEGIGIECARVDEIPGAGLIYNQIISNIKKAFFLVADLTGERPNCYYELGFAHALGRQQHVIIAARHGEEIHFDLRGYKTIFYTSPDDLRVKLREYVVSWMLSTEPNTHDDDTQNGEFGRCAVANGRVLTARIERSYEDEDGDRVCAIRFQVEALRGAPELRGQVTFFTHEDFDDRTVTVRNGVASVVLEGVAGAFTVGAVADRGKTRLEFDLGKIPGGPPSFYDPALQK